MLIIQNKYKKVADFCYELFRISKLPLYFSKYSNKIYSNYNHIFMLVYKQFRRFTYEELLTDLSSNKELRTYLGLNRLPHYTTLIKFVKRLPTSVIQKLVIAFKKLIPSPKKVAIDATGFSLDNASLHYASRIGLPIKKRPFMKATFIVDIQSYIILLCRFRKKPRNDTKDAKPMIKKLAKHYKPAIFYGDRGYDDNNIFKLVFEELDAYPLILQKNLHVPKHRKSGEYRKITCDVFDYGEYLQRNKIETTNGMVKKRFGSNTKSKVGKIQKIDLLLRVVAYNIDRLLRISKVLLIFIRIKRVSY